MKSTVFNTLGMYHGERIVEVQWIRDKVFGVYNKKIVDVGCINRHDAKGFVGTSKYCINNTNTIISIDQDNQFPVLGKYELCDIMTQDSCGVCFNADIIICVSTFEHVGLDIYKGEINERGDFIAMKNMLEWLNPDGHLYLTVPMAENYRVIDGFARIYSTESIMNMAEQLSFNANIEIYAHTDKWNLLESEDELKTINPIPDNAGMPVVGCIDITKKRGMI